MHVRDCCALRRHRYPKVARCADGVVVGSALVNVIRDNLANRAGLPARLRITAADLVAGVASPAAEQ